MDTQRLIDAIMRQTTILIAQVSTAAGARSPLSRVADQVFLELAREIEAQGVTRKVAADMFGLALRSYQKKIQRLSESVTYRDETLWGAVVHYLRQAGGSSRQALLRHFRAEQPADLAAVLKDLVRTGVASSTGRGSGTYYELTSAHARTVMAKEADRDAIADLIWLQVYDLQETSTRALLASLHFDPVLSAQALGALIEDGRVECVRGKDGDDDVLRCTRLTIPVGAERGWEAAVFDHFRAVATAIAAKLRNADARSAANDRIGGSTLSFSLEPGHPFEDEVYGLLQRVRGEVNELWNRVSAHNAAHPPANDKRIEVTFYFGQNVIGDEAPSTRDMEDDDA